MLDTTIAHFYAWLRTRDMPRPDRALWLARPRRAGPGLPGDGPALARGLQPRLLPQLPRPPGGRDLRDQAAEALSELILPRVHHAAVRRDPRAPPPRRPRRAAHRRARLPRRAAAATSPTTSSRRGWSSAAGAFTGELAEPPLTADGRASIAARGRRRARRRLADCHAYGDSISDLPLLEVVGHPHAVNPDFRLAREARRRHWPVLEWETEPGARTAARRPRGRAVRREADARARVHARRCRATSPRACLAPRGTSALRLRDDLDPPRLPGPRLGRRPPAAVAASAAPTRRS